MSWFRVDANLVDHPKTRRLEQLLSDPRAGWYVVRAWSWLSRFCPTGHVGDRDAVSFEQSCEWRGEPGKLREAFIEVGFLDLVSGGGFEWHDWDDLQGKVAENAKKERDRKRAYRAKKKAEQEALLSHGTDDGRPALRNGTERDGTEQKELSLLPAEDVEEAKPQAVFEHWRTAMKKTGTVKFDDKRKRAVKARLTDGYSVGDLKLAIDGCAMTPHNMGVNERQERFDDLELICRNSSQVERFRTTAQTRGGATVVDRPDAEGFSVLKKLAEAHGLSAYVVSQLAQLEWSLDDDGVLVGVAEDKYFKQWCEDHYLPSLTGEQVRVDAAERAAA